MRRSIPPPDRPGQISALDLFRQAQAGCPDSLNRLMAEHDGLVHAVVRQQALGRLSFAAALAAGRIGLWRAIQGYDAQRGLAFSTYAWPSIAHQVWAAVQQAQHAARRPTEIPASLPPAGLDPGVDPFSIGELAAVHSALAGLVARLPGRLRTIVVAYYGLGDDPPLSFRRLGATLGLSGQRIHQLHGQALLWLRHPAHSQQLRSLLGRHTRADHQKARTQADTWLRQRRRHGYGR